MCGTEPPLPKMVTYSTGYYHGQLAISFGVNLFSLPCLNLPSPTLPCPSWSYLPDMWPASKSLFQDLHLREPKVRLP